MPGSQLVAGQPSSAAELSLLTLMGELCEDMCLERRPKDRGWFSEIDTTVYHPGCQNTGNACCELSVGGHLRPWGPGPGLYTGAFLNYPHLPKDQCLLSPSPACQWSQANRSVVSPLALPTSCQGWFILRLDGFSSSQPVSVPRWHWWDLTGSLCGTDWRAQK